MLLVPQPAAAWKGRKNSQAASSLRIKCLFSLFGEKSQVWELLWYRDMQMLFPCELTAELPQVLAGHSVLSGSARDAPLSCVSWVIPRDDIPGLRWWGAAVLVLLWQICFVSQQAFSLVFAWGKQQTTNKCGLNQKHL